MYVSIIRLLKAVGIAVALFFLMLIGAGTPDTYAALPDVTASNASISFAWLAQTAFTPTDSVFLPLIIRSPSIMVTPTAPSDIQATALSASEVLVTWQDNADNELGFTLYEGLPQWIADVGPNVTSYTVGGLLPETYHCFTAFAFNDYGRSDWGGWGCTTTLSQGVTCTDLIINGGFETDSAWELPLTEHPATYTTAIVHNATRALRTGILQGTNNVESYSSARQLISVPTEVQSVTLTFWMYLVSDVLGMRSLPVAPQRGVSWSNFLLAPENDVQYVLVLDEEDQMLDILFWERQNDQAWTYYQYDLTPYVGQSIKIQFGTYNNGLDGVTSMYVDDVALSACE